MKMKKLLCIIGLCSLLSSCITDVKLDEVNTDISLSPALALPIGDVHVHMTDLLNFVDSSFISTDSLNGIYVFYEQNDNNIAFTADEFSTGERLQETLTLTTVEEVNQTIKTADEYIDSINYRIKALKQSLIDNNLNEPIAHITPPDDFLLTEDLTNDIDNVNKQIDIVNDLLVNNILGNVLPNITIKEIEELELIKKLDEFTIPKDNNFLFSKHTKYNFGFNDYDEGVSDIHIDSAVITHADIDLELEIENVNFSNGDYLLVHFHFPKILDDSLSNIFENIKITNNKFSFHDKMEHFMAHFDDINNSNETDLSIDFELVSNGGLTLTRKTKINFDVQIKFMNFDELYGHVWQKEKFQGGEIAFDVPTNLFNSSLLNDNNILFYNPQIDFKFNHNMGIPMLLEIDNFYYIKDNIKHEYENNESCKFTIGTPDAIKGTNTSHFTLDNTNSPIAKILQEFPEHVGVNWSIYTNDSTRNSVHFLTNPIEASMDMSVTIPFQFDKMTQISYKDTINADLTSILSSITDIAEIDTLCLYLDILSHLPATTNLKLYFLDENSNLIFETNYFEIIGAIVDEQGKVATPTEQNKTISINNDLIQDIVKTKQIMFDVNLKGYDNESLIYIQSTDKIDIMLSAYVKPKINITSKSLE